MEQLKPKPANSCPLTPLGFPCSCITANQSSCLLNINLAPLPLRLSLCFHQTPYSQNQSSFMMMYPQHHHQPWVL
ncbi:hypothetical protein AB3S75_014264 [Citrus x aurantiifolia]